MQLVTHAAGAMRVWRAEAVGADGGAHAAVARVHHGGTGKAQARQVTPASLA